MAEEWRPYFETASGEILRSQESFDTPEEAAMWGRRILSSPRAFELEDPDGYPTEARGLDPEVDFTV
jgi:hypothetical protein